MMPAQEHNEELKEWRVNSWKNRIAPEGYAFPGDPRNWEQTKYERAELSEKGEKLLGLKNGNLQTLRSNVSAVFQSTVRSCTRACFTSDCGLPTDKLRTIFVKNICTYLWI